MRCEIGIRQPTVIVAGSFYFHRAQIKVIEFTTLQISEPSIEGSIAVLIRHEERPDDSEQHDRGGSVSLSRLN